MKSQVTGDTWINLTQSTVNFCRHYMTVCESCAILAKIEALRPEVELLLHDMFVAQHSIKPSPNAIVDVSEIVRYFSLHFTHFSFVLVFQLNFVSRNSSYLLDTLLPVVIARYEQISGSRNELLAKLRMPPKPKPRSIYKTDVI